METATILAPADVDVDPVAEARRGDVARHAEMAVALDGMVARLDAEAAAICWDQLALARRAAVWETVRVAEVRPLVAEVHALAVQLGLTCRATPPDVDSIPTRLGRGGHVERTEAVVMVKVTHLGTMVPAGG